MAVEDSYIQEVGVIRIIILDWWGGLNMGDTGIALLRWYGVGWVGKIVDLPKLAPMGVPLGKAAGREEGGGGGGEMREKGTTGRRGPRELQASNTEGGGNTASPQLARRKSAVHNNAKFQETSGRTAVFERIESFHTGLVGKLGLPHPRLLEAMENEHCRRGDSEDLFEPGNYNTRTTPKREWEVLATDESRAKMSTGPRRIRRMEEIMRDENVREANLLEEEILALQLYTG
eukprot:688718-Hanusia_phi.AAC.1